MIIQKTSASLGRSKERQLAEYAMVNRHRVNLKGEPQRSELEIHSKTIQKALHTVFRNHSQVDVLADPIVLRKPYYSLFHCRQEIKELANRELNTPEEKQHLEWLTDFISDELVDLEKIHESLVKNGLIEFRHLPIIF